MTSWNRDYFKVVLLGDVSTGKSCLAKRYFQDQFGETERPVSSHRIQYVSWIFLLTSICLSQTISAVFETRVFPVGGKEYQMGVWDTTGEEKYISALFFFLTAGRDKRRHAFEWLMNIELFSNCLDIVNGIKCMLYWHLQRCFTIAQSLKTTRSIYFISEIWSCMNVKKVTIGHLKKFYNF